jgi:hypothetical protein
MGAAWQILNKAESGKRKSGKQGTGAQRFPLSRFPVFQVLSPDRHKSVTCFSLGRNCVTARGVI